ncbi:MAG: hypothetical protein EOP92_17685, partial [Lysobacteraceae bacterium]
LLHPLLFQLARQRAARRLGLHRRTLARKLEKQRVK